MPPALRGALRTEPSFVDLTEEARSRGKTLTPAKVSFIASPIRGRKPSDLVGEDLRQRRRARLLVMAGALSLAVLIVVAIITAGVAERAREKARESNLTTQSDALASQALAQRSANPRAAALLALAAWRSAPTAAARGSLLSISVDGYGGTLIGAGDVYRAAMSPDGRYLATTVGVWKGRGGRADNTVRLWDVRTRRQVAVFPVTGPVTSVAFSPNGRLLAIGLRTVELIDIATMSPIAFLPGGFSDLYSLTFSRNGRLLAVGGETGSIANPYASLPGLTLVWNVATRTQDAKLPVSGTVNSVAFSPDSHLLASGSDDGKITLWSTASHRMLPPLTGADACDAVAFGPGGR